MSEYLKLPDGREVRAGQLFADARREQPRLLRVEAIADPWRDMAGHLRWPVHCAVVERVPGGGLRVLRLPPSIDAERLLGRDFVPVTEDELAGER